MHTQKQALSLFKKTPLALLITACILPASAGAEPNNVAVHPSPYAEQFGYPYTRKNDRNPASSIEIPMPAISEFDGLLSNPAVTRPHHPNTSKSPVENFYGDEHFDDYRWLEEVDETDLDYVNETTADRQRDYTGTIAEDPVKGERFRRVQQALSEVVPQKQSETSAWVDAQNATTERYLAGISYAKQITDGLWRLHDYEYRPRPTKRKSANFYSIRTGVVDEKGRKRIVVRTDKDGSNETVLLDERTLSADGYAINRQRWFSEGEGSYMAYTINTARADTDPIYLNIKDTKTGKDLLDTPIQIGTGEGNVDTVAWDGDDTLYHIKTDLGAYAIYKTVIKDGKVISKPFLDGAQFPVMWLDELSVDGDYLVFVGNMHTTAFMNLKTGKFTRIHNQKRYDKAWSDYNKTDYFSTEYVAADVIDFDEDTGEIYYRSQDDYDEGTLYKTNLKNPDKYRQMVFPAKTGWLLEDIVKLKDKFYAVYRVDGLTRLYELDEKGVILKDLTPGIGTIAELEAYDKEADEAAKLKDKQDDNADTDLDPSDPAKAKSHISYKFSSFIKPLASYRYDPIAGQVYDVYNKDNIPFNSDAYEIKTFFYTARDGVKVPMTIAYKKGLALDGNNPTLLYGYGGYGVKENPDFYFDRAAWLENGGVYALANIRGGGEFGRAWQMAARERTRITGYYDFIDAAEYLKQQGYTSADRLAINGYSNGGLLVGATMVLKPDVAKVALPEYGVLDLFRHNKGKLTHWANEKGTPEDSEQMYTLLKTYSPYHAIKDGACYPATLITTSKRDDRVIPWHSYKFAARLQEKQACPRPVLLHTFYRMGHNSQNDAEIVERISANHTFAFHEMGIKSLPYISGQSQKQTKTDGQ